MTQPPADLAYMIGGLRKTHASSDAEYGNSSTVLCELATDVCFRDNFRKGPGGRGCSGLPHIAIAEQAGETGTSEKHVANDRMKWSND